jgi:cysteinyl-tRNA synthetase, unknown class
MGGLWGPMLPTRRSVLAAMIGGVATMASRSHAAAAGDFAMPRLEARKALAGIRRWGCQYQNVSLREIASSDLDLIVIDPSLNDDDRRFVTPHERAMLQQKPDGGRRLVLAYLCVGEADVKRWYWPRAWKDRPPSWLGPENPNWPGSHHVRYWSEEWQDLVHAGSGSILDRIIDTGFDGALLDRVDAYLDWPGERPDLVADMIDQVSLLATKARASMPGFLLLPQNAELLLPHPRYTDLIDAHNKESLLTGLDGEGIANKGEDVAWSLGYLRMAQRAGVRMLATEYMADPQIIAGTKVQLDALGFLPFFGNRALDRLPKAVA